MNKVDRIKELLGLGVNTTKEDMDEHHREIIEEVKEKE